MGLFRFRKKIIHEIAPDEIFLDSSNLPRHDEGQFEGRVVRPVEKKALAGIGILFSLVVLVFFGRAVDLQIAHGDDYSEISRENRLDRTVMFAARGLIYDRTGRELAWNIASSTSFSQRRYSEIPGLSHLLGFVSYPKRDANGTWWREDTSGISGSELAFDSILRGKNGSTMVETDALGRIERQQLIATAANGADLTLSVDAEVQSKLYSILSQHAQDKGFQGGASVIMDVRTGEILALASFPEYDNQGFTNGDKNIIQNASTNSRTPMLNRAVAGLYTPGSIVKPMFAAAALNEGIISPDKKILSVGAITLPNPYNPDLPSVFRDWTVHGLVDMREAIAVSSDEYFYTIGGGYGGQKGLGINRLDEYARKFGIGAPTGIALLGEEEGVIPTPDWKERVFGREDPWRIGDTYHTAIGQYGFQVTPIQAVHFIGAIANGGKILKPQLIASSTPEYTNIDIPDSYLQIVREGMRMAVTSTRKDATVKALNIGGIEIAAKTGTAQTGVRNESMNSWSVGFWPAQNPKWAYATVLEKAPAGTLSGAAPAMLPFFQWLIVNKQQYVH
ncbi:MAG TPA: penicillin-binding transpeptidase domain-containing protein [Candidatus Paceibacterota bacterium]